MRVLENYILTSVIKSILACLLVFVLLYIIADLFSNLDEILRQRANLSTIFSYYLTYIPIIFVQVIGFACLFGVIYTFSVFNKNNELIAMRASGINLLWINRAIFVLIITVCLFSLWLNTRVIPKALERLEYLKSKLNGRTYLQKPKVLENIYFYGIKNRLFYANKFHIEENTLEGITILEHDSENNLVRKIVADKAVFKNGLWYFLKCIVYYFDTNGDFLKEPIFSEEEIFAFPETPKDFLRQIQKPEFMENKEVHEYIRKLSKSKTFSALRNFKIIIYQRFNLSFTSLFLVILGLPLALRTKTRIAGLHSLGNALLLGFIYYLVNAISFALGSKGFIPPLLSGIAAPLLSMIVSIPLLLENY